MGSPVVHWEIAAKNSGLIRDFYAAAFDWKINANNPMNYGIVVPNKKVGIGGGIAQADENMPGPSVTFYIEVKDLQETLARIESLGGRTVVPPMEIPDMVTFATFADPEGNVIGLVKAMPPPPKKKVKRPVKKAVKKATRPVKKKAAKTNVKKRKR